MLLRLDQRVIFVGGKGGVGKTTIAGALATLCADRRRCLLVSTDPAHSLGDLFGVAIGDRERQLADRLWGLEIDPERETSRHIATVKEQLKTLVHPRMYDEVDRHLDRARLAPGTMEAALLDRTADLVASAGERFDQVIFDTAPTGHTLRLLSLPEMMTAWTDGLLKHQQRSSRLSALLKHFGSRPDARREASGGDAQPERPLEPSRERLGRILLARQAKLKRARELLLDRTNTAFILVLNPDRLSIIESRKARRILHQVGIPVVAVVVNRVLPESADGAFVAARRRLEAPYLAEIGQEFGDVPRVVVPLLAEDLQGVEALRRLASVLASSRPTPRA